MSKLADICQELLEHFDVGPEGATLRTRLGEEEIETIVGEDIADLILELDNLLFGGEDDDEDDVWFEEDVEEGVLN